MAVKEIYKQRNGVFGNAPDVRIRCMMYTAGMNGFLSRQWQFKILLLFTLVNLGGILAFQPFVVSGDSVAYFETAKFLGGLDGGVLHPVRILKPLGPFVAYIIGSWTGLGIEGGLLWENAIFYLLMVPAVYYLLRRMAGGNDNQALWGSMLFLSAYPVLAYSVSYMTDVSGWFFTILGYYFVVKLLDERNIHDSFWVGLVVAVGFLFKEYVAAVGIFFVLAMFLASGFWWEDRLRALGLFALPFMVVSGGWQVFVWLNYGASYLDWYQAGGVAGYELKILPFVVKSFAGVFLLGWVFALAGLWTLWRESRARELFLLKLLAFPSVSFLLWHVASSRIYFIAGIPAAFLAGVYLERLRESNRTVFWGSMVSIIAVSYVWYLLGDVVRPAIWPGIEL